MMGKRIASFKNLAKKVKRIKTRERGSEYVLLGEGDDISPTKTSTVTFPVYVGEERVRQVVPMSYLNHPLFRMLLDKSRDFTVPTRKLCWSSLVASRLFKTSLMPSSLVVVISISAILLRSFFEF